MLKNDPGLNLTVDLGEARVIEPKERERLNLGLGVDENYRIVNSIDDNENGGNCLSSADRTRATRIVRNREGSNGDLSIGARVLPAMWNMRGEQNTGNLENGGRVLAVEDVGRVEGLENEEDVKDKKEQKAINEFQFDSDVGCEKDEAMVSKGNRRRFHLAKSTENFYVGESSRKRKKKELVGVEIMELLLTAGWQIGLKQRKGKDQEEVVYFTPKGKTYYSITSAYQSIKMHYEAGDGSGKFYLRDFKFKPLPDDQINMLEEKKSTKRKRQEKSTPTRGKSENVIRERKKKNRKEKQDESECKHYNFIDVSDEDPNDDTCLLCGEGGDLICCDSCPSTFHLSCLKIDKVPSGDWHCTYCRCNFCGLASRSSQETETLDDYTASILTCFLCEHRYHKSCLEKNGIQSEHSSDACFCGNRCRELFERLQRLIGVKHEIGHGFSWTFISRSDVGFQAPHIVEYKSKLAIALSIMEESFKPQIDHRSGINMIHSVLYNCGSNFNRLNYKRFFTAILERGDEIICVASLRVHENKVAEMPFIATRRVYRRQGMCRRFLTTIETALSSLGVELLVIPSVPQLTTTWTSAFGFEPIDLETKNTIRNMKLFLFSNAIMLKKKIRNDDSSVREHDDPISAEVPNLGMNQQKVAKEPNNSSEGNVSGGNISKGSLAPNANHDEVLFPGSSFVLVDDAPNQEDDVPNHSASECYHLNISDHEAIPLNAGDEAGSKLPVGSIMDDEVLFPRSSSILVDGAPNQEDDITNHNTSECHHLNISDHEAIPSNAYDEAGSKLPMVSIVNDEVLFLGSSSVPVDGEPNQEDYITNHSASECHHSNTSDHEVIPSNAYDEASSKLPTGSIMNDEHDGVISKMAGEENRNNLELDEEINDKDLECANKVVTYTLEYLNSISGIRVQEKRQGLTMPPISTEGAENSACNGGQNVFLLTLLMLVKKSFQASSEVDQTAPSNSPLTRGPNAALDLDLNYAPSASGAVDEDTVTSNQGISDKL